MKDLDGIQYNSYSAKSHLADNNRIHAVTGLYDRAPKEKFQGI